jgi:hypothetical protein
MSSSSAEHLYVWSHPFIKTAIQIVYFCRKPISYCHLFVVCVYLYSFSVSIMVMDVIEEVFWKTWA